MESRSQDHTLEYLLAFDRRIHWLEQGYFLKFEIKRVKATPVRPHGLRYSFTLHDPEGERVMGFDNAHRVRHPGSKHRKSPRAADHWHHSRVGEARPYKFENAEKLIEDYFAEVRRTLDALGVSEHVVDVTEKGQQR